MSLSLVVHCLVPPTGDNPEAPVKGGSQAAAQWIAIGWFVIAAIAYVVPYWVAAIRAAGG